MELTKFSPFLYKFFASMAIITMMFVNTPVQPAYAATTGEIVPTTAGTYSSWANSYLQVDEGVAAINCANADTIRSATNNQQESMGISLSSVPNGSIITSIDVLVADRADNIAGVGGTYATFVRFNGTNSANSATHATTANTCSGYLTDTFDVVDTIKDGTTTLEIGVVKINSGGATNNAVRVGVLSAIITYDTPPTGTDNTVAINEDTTHTFAAANFGFNDADAGDVMSAVRIDTLSLAAGSTLRFSGVDVTAGQVILTANIPNLVFTPASNANGVGYASFTFSVQDTNGPAFDLTPNTFTFNVTAVDDAPVAVADSATVTEDAAATAIDVLVNDTDVDGGTKLINSVTQSANGTVVITGGGTGLTYQPDPNYCNTPPGTTLDTFTYDLTPGGSTATVSVTVTCVNDAPSFTASNPPSVAVNPGAQTVNAWATFDPGTPNEAGQNVLQYNITGSTCGTLLSAGPSVSIAGVLTYTPATDRTGTCTFDVRVQDDGGTANGGADTSSPAQTFTISVAVPVITLSPVTLPNGTLLFAYFQTITASGGTAPYTFAITAGTLPTGLTLSSAGVLSGTPTALGTFNFTVTATDSSGGSGPFTGSQAYSITINNGMAVTIDQAVGQADPTNVSPINFTVVFNAVTTNFVTGDVTLSGTAGATTAIVTGSGTTYNVAVSGMTNGGTVIATVAAGVATDAASNPNNSSTSTDNTVTYDSGNPTVVSTNLVASYTGTGPGSFVATFSEAVNDPAGNTVTDDVTNPANFLLVNKGTNGVTDTGSCAGGVVADDTQVTVTSVVYNPATFQTTVTLAGSLLVGSYRLFICGTTSIVDLAGNHLNGGSDYTFDFVVQASPQRTASTSLPATGFPQGQVTTLSAQPAELAYASYSDLWLELPKLGLKTSIVGVPQTSDGWNVDWLNRDAGWLNGSAFPTWSGNSVLTGHVWDALNRPGPFAGLKNLKYGDQVKIHAFGQVYIYEIRESSKVLPTRLSTVFKHEKNSWITLVTCEDYKENSQTYSYRRMVRAVLVSVTTE